MEDKERINKYDLAMKLQRDLAVDRRSGSVSSQRDVVVYINHSIPDEWPLESIQEIEEELDKALLNFGLQRTTTSKGEVCEIVYAQYSTKGDPE